MKGVLSVSLIDVNCRLWSHFKGVWDGKWLYLPIQVSLKAAHKEIYKNAMALATRSFKAYERTRRARHYINLFLNLGLL